MTCGCYCHQQPYIPNSILCRTCGDLHKVDRAAEHLADRIIKALTDGPIVTTNQGILSFWKSPTTPDK